MHPINSGIIKASTKIFKIYFNRLRLGRPHGQGHAGQGPAQGQPHGPDYSRQWEEYWKQMNPNQPHHSQSPYSAHGQVNIKKP